MRQKQLDHGLAHEALLAAAEQFHTVNYLSVIDQLMTSVE
jgi:hypothetical protein